MPGDTGDSKRRAGHDEERTTGHPRHMPCLQYRDVQDWQRFVAVAPRGGRIRSVCIDDISCSCASPLDLHGSPDGIVPADGMAVPSGEGLGGPQSWPTRSCPPNSQQVHAGNSSRSGGVDSRTNCLGLGRRGKVAVPLAKPTV